jgi:hypothetical protein
VKSTPLDPPQLDAAHAARMEATATLAAAAKKRLEVARRERCSGRRMWSSLVKELLQTLIGFSQTFLPDESPAQQC